MPQIIICAPSYNPSIGGAVVLHKLCHILNELNYDASLTTTIKLNGQTEYFVLNPDFNTKIASEIDINNDIVIYPEIESGNPFQSKNVIRYILNKFHLPEHGNTMATWGSEDYWLYFHDLFYDKIKEPNFLHILHTKIDYFINLNKDRDIESCFTFRKKSEDKQNLNIIHPIDSIEIPYNVSDEYLLDIFNRSKRFYSYDTETYLNILASLCGCESIVVPYKNLKKSDLLEKQPAFKYGVAYGLDDLKYANETNHKLKEYLFNLEKNQIEETKLAFDKIFNYFKI
jgi:hypothetical protein